MTSRSLLLTSKRLLTKFLNPTLSRPDLNFDYFLDGKNSETIRQNINTRKGVGNIDRVRKIWHEIQEYTSKVSQQVNASVSEYQRLWDELYEETLLLPNMCHPDVPLGDMSAARIVKTFGPEPVALKRQCLTAEKLVQSWRTVLYPREACGSRSYAFIGPLSYLEDALLSYASGFVEANGFKPVSVPDIVPQLVTAACGVQKRSDKDIQYHIVDKTNLCLSGTAEMGISDLIKDCIFHEKDLPVKLYATSRCFRPELSSSAAEARLYRVHEFTKTEMYIICKPSDSDHMLEELVELQCEIYRELGLHCRLLDMPSEELGAAAARKFDIEAWMPGRKIFGEVSSASNCADYQARRLNIKFKDEYNRYHFAHTCNATALAANRTLIAILECYQNDRKGLEKLPPVLRERLLNKTRKTVKLQISSGFSLY